MPRISADVWVQLEAISPTGGRLAARVAIPDISSRLFCAIDADNLRHLLVVLQPEDTGFSDRQSRGLSVTTRDLQIRGQETGRYLDITCRDPGGHTAFDLIGGEIAAELAKEHSVPADVVHHILAKWRRFWGLGPREMLSRTEVLGLFAELWFLSVWLIPQVGSEEALRRWRGPFGSRHDFEWRGRSVEVKATTSARGCTHHIHGLEQMEPPMNGDLFLYSLHLREEHGASNTLPSIVESCRALIETNEEALFMFETALMCVGYSPTHNDEYEKIRLRIADEALYTVSGNFPRLITSSIVGGVPEGLECVDYVINLNGYQHLICARQPSDGGWS